MKIIIDNSTKNSIIDKLSSFDEQISQLVNQKNAFVMSVNDDYGPEDELKIIKQNEDGTWSRLTISDNLESIKTGFWKSVKVDRFSTKIETLKNKPKELVEAK